MAVATAPAQLEREAYIRILLTRGVGELTYDLERDARAVARHHRQAARRAAGARVRARASRSRSSSILRNHPGVGQPDHQVEQPAQQRARDAGGASHGRRRSADVQLPRRAVGVLAVELLPGPRRRGADAAARRRDCSRASRARSCSSSGATSACGCEEATLRPDDLATARRGVHHQHDARAEPGRAGRRAGDRHRPPGPGDARRCCDAAARAVTGATA